MAEIDDYIKVAIGLVSRCVAHLSIEKAKWHSILRLASSRSQCANRSIMRENQKFVFLFLFFLASHKLAKIFLYLNLEKSSMFSKHPVNSSHTRSRGGSSIFAMAVDVVGRGSKLTCLIFLIVSCRSSSKHASYRAYPRLATAQAIAHSSIIL